jgi:hypothetical protein
MNEPLPRGEYLAFVGRSDRRPTVEVYAWSLRDRLPTIPIPLKAGDLLIFAESSDKVCE